MKFQQYDDEKDEKHRLKKFKKFLKSVDERNAAEEKVGGSAIHGITKFADLSEEEFDEMFNNFQLPTEADQFPDRDEPVEYNGAATAVNWVGILVGPVKNQGYCGSCWAFSAAMQMESAAIKAGILTPTAKDALSTQQMVSCNTATSSPAIVIRKGWWNAGCNGGNQQKAYFYVFQLGGLTTEALYPYTSGTTSRTGTCDKTKETNFKIKVTSNLGFKVIGETAQIAYVLGTGPLTSTMNGSILRTYVSGIISASTCSTTITHAVQIVGVDTVKNYWILQNTYGADWGMSGFFWLELNKNCCGVATYTTYVNVAAIV